MADTGRGRTIACIPPFVTRGVLASFAGRATVSLMPHQPQPRRLPAPWCVERIPAGWAVLDASERRLAYVYGSDERAGVADDRLTLDEARRVAANIAQLPELLAAPSG